MSEKALTVTQLNTYIRQVLNNDPILINIKLVGELRDVKKVASGHTYFSVIDEQSSISAILFEFNRHNLKGYEPKDGDQVEIRGNINVYVKGGRYSINVTYMGLAGQGAKLIALKKLTEKLEKEGLFKKHKRQINLYPNNIGIITARNSAACQDLVTNINRRFPLTNIYAFYSAVQGAEAKKEIIEALNKAYKFTPKLDTIIISRGGGSNEDLDAFNDEAVVRKASESPIPIIAAIGHEVDFTLIEYVADKRASTPTGAAELATIDKREVYESLDNALYTMESTLANRLKIIKEKLYNLSHRPFFTNPASIYADKVNELKLKKDRLNNLMQIYLNSKMSDLRSLSEKLQALNPNKVLNRGFALIKGKNGKIIMKASEVSLGEEIVTTFKDGNVYSEVIKKEKHI